VEENQEIALQTSPLSQKISDYVALTKPRLASLVVFSSVAGYFMADVTFSWTVFLQLIFGGILVTGSSNGLNQILEIEQDAVMKRTQNRPLPQKRLSPKQALIFSVAIGIIGLWLLYSINTLCFIMGLSALFSYVVIYTPMKKVSPIAVLIGAFPGSIPPMIGYVAASGKFGLEPGILFAVQFFWQFPHFWAIAWKLHDDYTLAGYKMLPSSSGRSKQSAWQILFYTILMFPVALLPWAAHMTGNLSAILAIALNLAFLFPAYKLYKTLDMKYATQLMFSSFVYLPILFIIYLIDKI
jgi:heme o synthase